MDGRRVLCGKRVARDDRRHAVTTPGANGDFCTDQRSSARLFSQANSDPVTPETLISPASRQLVDAASTTQIPNAAARSGRGEAWPMSRRSDVAAIAT